MLVNTIGMRQVVAVADGPAQGRGVRVGMSLAEARALCPGLQDAPYQPREDMRTLGLLARWMMRFSPVVAIDQHGGEYGLDCGNGPGGQQDEAYLPAVFVDVSGCQRVFGGLGNLLEEVTMSLDRLGIAARLAIAPTLGAAWAIARQGAENGVIVPQEKLRAALAPLPPTALRIDWPVIEALHQLGVQTIGQLLELPREALPARFGDDLLRRIDQALGRIAEPLNALAYQAPIQAQVDFDGVTSCLEAIWLTFKELIQRVIVQLTQHGCGARRMEVRFFRADAPPIVQAIDLSKPSRDGVNMFNLMRCAMERLETAVVGAGHAPPSSHIRNEGSGAFYQNGPKGASHQMYSPPSSGRSQCNDGNQTNSPDSGWHGQVPLPVAPRARALAHATQNHRKRLLAHVASPEGSLVPCGFTGVGLKITVFEPLGDRQGSLLDQTQQATERELDYLIERLMLRLGQESVVRAELVESHLPERAYATVRHDMLGNRSPFPPPLSPLPGQPSHAARPLHLLVQPMEIAVMVGPSDDNDGPPISLIEQGQARQVAYAIGPERIAGQWWEGHNKTRDYFAVEDYQGQRSWVFHVLETGKWYVQGRFE